MDLKLGDSCYTLDRCAACDERLSLLPKEKVFAEPGVPLWLTGSALERAIAWMNDHKESVDWRRFLDGDVPDTVLTPEQEELRRQIIDYLFFKGPKPDL